MIIITILEAIFFLLLFLIGLFCVLYAIVKIIQFLTYVPYNQTYEFNPNDLPDENKTIKVFDYNCFWRPWLLHIGTIEHVRERSQLLTERLDDFDILCLNESFHFGSTVVKDFIAVMNKKGFKYVVNTPRVPIFSHWVVDSGVTILSKYPIIETDYIPYTNADHWCWFAMKSCLYARIQISKKQHINVFATHLQATSPKKFEIHLDQYRDIHHLMMKHCSTDNAPIILTGDMNTGSNDEKHYNEMIEGIKMPNYTTIDTHKFTDGKRTIDFMFIFDSKDETDLRFKKCDIQFDEMPIEGKPYRNLSDHPSIKNVIEFE